MQQELNKKFFELRRKELDSAFDEIKADLQELAEHFYPRSVRFLAKEVNKTRKKRNTQILDSTPVIAVRNFYSGMMSGATSPAQNWFKFRIRNYNMENDYEVKSWCAAVEKLMRDALNASKIYEKLPIVYKQLGVFGFSTLAFESDYDDIFVSKVLPIGSYRYAKNFKGEVDTLAREYSETAKNIVEQFGEENVSDAVKKAAKKSPQTYFEVVHIVMPNPNFDSTKVWAKNKKFISAYYEISSKEDKLLSISGFNKFPYIVFEAETNGEDVYPSDCPAINALPDVKQLNTMVKEYAKAVKKIVSPPMKGPAKFKDRTISTLPESYIEDVEGDDKGVRPIHEVPPQILQLKEQIYEMKNTVKEHFYNDLFAMILNTAERGRTATEVNELKEEKMVLLSPLLEQIHSSLSAAFEWIFEEFVNDEILPPPPEQIQGGEIDIEFVSTLAQAQKVQRIAAMERFSTFTINLANSLDPVLRNKLNGCKMIDDYADFANIDPSQVQPTEVVEQIRQQQAQEAEQQKQMQALQQGTEMIKNMGGVDAFGANLAERVGM